jgi:anti-sigma B factor antagonist
MQIEERSVGDIVVLAVSGEITMRQGGGFVLKDKVCSLIGQGQLRLLLDLKDVSRVDSAGLGELVQASYVTSKNAGGSLKLVNLRDNLKELLRSTRLNTVFEICDNAEAAIASFSPSSRQP